MIRSLSSAGFSSGKAGLAVGLCPAASPSPEPPVGKRCPRGLAKLAAHPRWFGLTAGRHGKDGKETGLPPHVQPQTISRQTAGEKLKKSFPLCNPDSGLQPWCHLNQLLTVVCKAQRQFQQMCSNQGRHRGKTLVLCT